MTDYYYINKDLAHTTVCSAWDKGYRYGFNTQEKDDDVFIGAYTAEYWEYDSRLGRRWNLDPIPQVTISDYSVLRNNPYFFIDIKGDEFDESSQKVVDNHKVEIKNKIEVLQDYKKSLLGLMTSGGDNTAYWNGIDQANKAINELNTQLSEIEEMEKSKTIFTIEERDDIKDGKTQLLKDGRIKITIPKGNKGLLSHELKHGHQSISGKMSYYKVGDEYNTGILSDIIDEVEAFRAQWAITYYENNFDLYEDITPSNILQKHSHSSYNLSFLKTINNITLDTKLTMDILRWYFGSGVKPKRKYYKKYLGKPISKYINEIQNEYEVVL
jgi:hypothetical protein